MQDSESVLVVPLRSNAYTLLAGKPIAAMRRRLKFASLFHDRLILETGIVRVQAGPDGFSSFIVPPAEHDPVRWQTPAQRHAATGQRFTVMLTPEGRPEAAPRPVVSSEASISWTATLHPFQNELPPGTDWVDFRKSVDPAGEIAQIAQRWIRTDERNQALQAAIPDRFARQVVIDSLNRDLVLAAAAGCAVIIDPFHMQVVAQRFRDEGGWGLQGYSVPVLFPRVGDLPWDVIANMRRDRNMVRFRSVLREVEQEAAAEAVGGDLGTAAHHAYERHLADASGRLEGVATAVRRTGLGIVISGGAGAAALPFTGPLGIIVSTAIGTIPTAVINVRSVLRANRSRGWVALHHRIRGTRD